MIVHQWVPAAHRGDAVGDSARRFQAILHDLGHESEIFALSIDEDLAGVIRPFDQAEARRADVVLYHYALPSALSEAFARVDGYRVLHYHNVTPAHFFAPFDPGLARLAALGREQLATLPRVTDLALGVSEFNRQELAALGFSQTGVLPLALDLERLRGAPPRPGLEKILGDGLRNFLFVGRIAPNKKIEDHIRLAEFYKRYVDTQYRFIFVGKTEAVPRYYAAVRALVLEYRMLAERFLFTGAVPDAELAAYYRHASVYVSLSEHEGFCVPLVEAMAMDVPVLAYGAAAIPETLAGAGVMFSPKDLEFAAEVMAELAYNRRLRERVVSGQRARLQAFRLEAVAGRLAEVLAGAGAPRQEMDHRP
jgi:glycosyltransferase involved in cell wall biosynthesis